MPNEASFTAATSTPAAAAARSLARTASICSPSRERRRRITAMHDASVSTNKKSPNPPVGILPSPRKNSLVGPNSTPRISGGSVFFTVRSRPNQPDRKKKISSMARPLAKVTIARLAPRVRSDGSAAISPKPTPQSTASGKATSIGMPAEVPKDATANPETPASAICISEIWPT